MFSELKKLFSSWLTFICLGITFVFLAVFVVNASKSKDETIASYENILSDFSESGMSEEEICDILCKNKNSLELQVNEAGDLAFQKAGEYTNTLMGDYLLFSKAYNTANYIYVQIPYDRRKIVNDSLYNISEELEKPQPDESIIRNNEHVIEKYNRVISCELKSTGDLETMYLFFDNTIWDYVMIAFVIMITVRMFTMDISSGAYRMIYSSVKGRKRLFVRQFAAVGIVVTVTLVLNAVCQLFCGMVFLGVTNFSLPLQMVSEYEFCPYMISIGEYLCIKLIAKILFYLMILSLSAMITVLWRKVLVSFASLLIIGIAPLITITHFFLYSLDQNSNALQSKYQTYNAMRCLLPHSLLNIDVYFQAYDEFSIFGFQLSRLFSVCLVTVFIIAVCFIIGLCKFGCAKKR